MSRVERMLERFEDKHGTHRELVEQICWHKIGSIEYRKFDRLIREIDKLIYMYMGYAEGYKAGLKEGKG